MSTTRKIPAVWTEPRTLRCWPYNPPLQWLVESESHPTQPHLVDLGAYAGNGECSCKDFSTRRAPELKAGRRPSPLTRCKHIKAARERLLNRVILTVTQQQEPKK